MQAMEEADKRAWTTLPSRIDVARVWVKPGTHTIRIKLPNGRPGSIPGVKVGFAGVARNEETAQPQEYYAKLPDLSDAFVLICEPMLATGGSLSWAVDKVKGSGARSITCLCVVTAPEGVKRMYEDHPDVEIIAAAHDRELDESFYIVPGLGDMGDRLFGTL